MSFLKCLYKNLSEQLDIPLSEIDSDFLLRECELTDRCEDFEQEDQFPPYDVSSIASYTMTEEDMKNTNDLITDKCVCETKIRYNYFIRHRKTEKFFVLGSSCVRRFDENAFKKKCDEESCSQFCQTKKHAYCQSHKRICNYCGKTHLNGQDCKKRDDSWGFQCPLCKVERKQLKSFCCRACFLSKCLKA